MIPSATSTIGSRPPAGGGLAIRPAPILVLLCLVLGLAAVAWRAKAHGDAARARARIEALTRGAALESEFNQATTAAEVLGALVKQSGGVPPGFQGSAVELIASHPGLSSLELAPGGVVGDIAPRAGRERRIGFNVLKDPAQGPGASAAVRRRAPTAAGPLTLEHGEPGIVVRVPVFQRGRDGRDSFWGLVAASMPLPGALARARINGLSAQGYDYALLAGAAGAGKPAVIATHGSFPLQDAVQQPVRVQNLELRLALRPRAGWVSPMKVAFECLGVIAVCGLLWVAVSRWDGPRLASEAGEGIFASKPGGGAKEDPEAAQGQLRFAEEKVRLQEAARSADIAKQITQTKLKEAQARADELQARLDSVVRATDETAQARQAEIQEAHEALGRAEHERSELQARLEADLDVERKAAAAARTELKKARSRADELQARLQAQQVVAADLESRLEAAHRAQAEETAASVSRLERSEASNKELQERLVAAAQLEARIVELTALLEEAQARAREVQTDSDTNAAALVVKPAPVIQNETATADAAPVEAPPADPPSPVENPAPAEVPAPAPAPAETASPAKRMKRRKARPDLQIDLFESQVEPAKDPTPAPPPEPVASMPEPAPEAASEPAADDRESNADQEAPDQNEALELPVIEGLAAAEDESNPPAAARPPGPVNIPRLRKAVNEILPLLVDQDPGSKDCFKANRAVFRSAFSTEAFPEFERLVRESDLSAALEQLRKAVKRHGISV